MLPCPIPLIGGVVFGSDCRFQELTLRIEVANEALNVLDVLSVVPTFAEIVAGSQVVDVLELRSASPLFAELRGYFGRLLVHSVRTRRGLGEARVGSVWEEQRAL